MPEPEPLMSILVIRGPERHDALTSPPPPLPPSVLGALVQNERLGRPDNYYATLPTRYRAIDAGAINQAAAQYLQGEGLVFVVVGDRKVVEPQLKGIGLSVEVAQAVDSAAASGK